MAGLTTIFGKSSPKNRDVELFEAAERGRVKTVARLLARGADPDPRDQKNCSPLYVAAAGGHAKIVALLLKAGASPNAGESGSIEGTPLTVAAAKGHFEVVRLLVEAKAKLSDTGYEKRTALHEAVWNLHEEVAVFLANAGIDPNTRSRMDHTPLQDAVASDLHAAAIALCENGADVKISDLEGFDMLTALKLKGWDDVIHASGKIARDAAEAARRQEAFAQAIDKAAVLENDLVVKKPLAFKGPLPR